MSVFPTQKNAHLTKKCPSHKNAQNVPDAMLTKCSAYVISLNSSQQSHEMAL